MVFFCYFDCRLYFNTFYLKKILHSIKVFSCTSLQQVDWAARKAFRFAGHRTCFTLLLMLDVNRETFLSLICRQMHFQDDFTINRYLNFDFKFLNFLDSKTLDNAIIFGAGRIAVTNLTSSYNGYEYLSLNVLCKCR